MDGWTIAWTRVTTAALTRALRRMVYWSCISGVTAWCAVAVLLLSRRLSGALEHPLSATALVVLAASLVLLNALVRGMWFASVGRCAPRLPTAVFSAAASAGVILAAVACSLPGSSTVALSCLWVLLVTAECAFAWLTFRRLRTSASLSTMPEEAPGSSSSPVVGSWHRADEEGVLPPTVTQQLTRAIDDAGADVLMGLLRATFEPGERTQNIHLAFCPSFADEPAISAEQVGGALATIKIAEVRTYGARLEVRLRTAQSTATDVTVETMVRSRSPA